MSDLRTRYPWFAKLCEGDPAWTKLLREELQPKGTDDSNRKAFQYAESLNVHAHKGRLEQLASQVTERRPGQTLIEFVQEATSCSKIADDSERAGVLLDGLVWLRALEKKAPPVFEVQQPISDPAGHEYQGMGEKFWERARALHAIAVVPPPAREEGRGTVAAEDFKEADPQGDRNQED